MIYGTVICGESKVDGSETRRIILIRLMQQKGLSNKKLAELSGLDKVSISRYRTGKSNLNDVPTLQKLAKGLNESVCVFFPGEEPKEFDELAIAQMLVVLLKRQQAGGIAGIESIEDLPKLLSAEHPPGDMPTRDRRSGNFRRATNTKFRS